MNLAALLDRSATTFGGRPAVGRGTGVLHDYTELRRRAAAVGHGLRSRHGLNPGDRVAIFMANDPRYVEVLLGAWWAGMVVVPVNAKLHSTELGYIIGHSGSAVCVTDTEHVDSVTSTGSPCLAVESDEYSRLLAMNAGPLVDREPDDLAWLFYTSGTTGRPKGAALTHRNLLQMALSYHADIDALDSSDVLIHAAPMSHGSGLYMVQFLAAAGCNVVPESGGFDTDEIVDLLDRWSSSSLFMAPTMIHRLVREQRLSPHLLPGLRTIVYGGGPMYVDDLHAALDAIGPRLAQIYGQGESPMTITALPKELHARGHPRAAERLRSTGYARTGVEVRVVDRGDHPVPVGELGEVVVRGDVVMSGYWDDPEATSEALRGGWLHTGDLGFLDSDGFLTLQDRSKDLIISGGSNIYPREVEEVLLQHALVAEASVVGEPDPEWGENVVAFVVTTDGSANPAPLDAWCIDNIARFKRPKHYRFVEALPKNSYGKVLKRELRTRLADEEADNAPSTDNDTAAGPR